MELISYKRVMIFGVYFFGVRININPSKFELSNQLGLENISNSG